MALLSHCYCEYHSHNFEKSLYELTVTVTRCIVVSGNEDEAADGEEIVSCDVMVSKQNKERENDGATAQTTPAPNRDKGNDAVDVVVLREVSCLPPELSQLPPQCCCAERADSFPATCPT